MPAEGELPTWYRAIKAGQFLGVPPWVMLEQPAFWTRAAEAAQEAETQAEANRKTMQNTHRK